MPVYSSLEDYRATKAQVEAIYNSYGTNQMKVDKDLMILKEWTDQHPHLPKNNQWHIHSASKFNVEKAKKRIVRFLILKYRSNDLYYMFSSSTFLPLSESRTILTPLPKLGPSNERIVILGVKPSDAGNYNIQHFYQLAIGCTELMARYHHTTPIRIIADGNGYTFDYVRKLEFGKLYRMLDLLINGYGSVIVGVDVINALPSAQFLFTAIKKVLNDKVIQKVKFHGSLESLYQSIPREHLPDEYGGSAGSIADFQVKINTIIDHHRDEVMNSANYVVDEHNLSIKDETDYDGLYGIDGTFKALNLD